MTGMKIIGWLAIIFGVLVFVFPHLLNDLVALFFVIVGINLLVWSGRMTKF